MKITTKQKNLKVILPLAIGGVLLLALVGYGIYTKTTQRWPFQASTTTQGTEQANSSQDINYDPPTDQEVENSQDGKKNSQPEATPSAPTSSLGAAHVALSYADFSGNQLEIRAFTTSVVEGSGTCTATVTSGLKKVTRSSSAFIDATSSICEPIYIDKSELSPGVWSINVSYLSKTFKGSSETVEVTYQ